MKAATLRVVLDAVGQVISIHAAREGGDVFSRHFDAGFAGFQSTPPVKAATNAASQLTPNAAISIHAAREGGDGAIIKIIHFTFHFNPRRP